MDLTSFNEAEMAIKKIVKDYQPVVDLATALVKVRVVLSEIGELEKAKSVVNSELVLLREEKAAAEAEVVAAKKTVERAQAVYADLKSKVAGIKL